MATESKFKAVVALSGGLDSGVLLSRILAGGFYAPDEVACINYQYRSKHNKRELASGARIAQHYKVLYYHFNTQSLIDPYGSSALVCTDVEIPEGHYEEESMRQTVVPGRNLVFAAALASFAESFGASEIFIGAHAGDHFIYPDCRPEFLSSLKQTIYLSTDKKVSLVVPFTNFNKSEIVRMGLADKFPFEKSWTCYKGGMIACGVCGSCQERLEAFHLNETEDPLPYETRVLLPKK